MMLWTTHSERFQKDGYLSGLRACGAEDALRIRQRFDALEAAEGRAKCQIGLLDRHFDQRFVWDLATHPEVLAAVEAAIGSDFMLLATHFFCKYPEAEAPGMPPAWQEERRHRNAGAERFVAWHQDVAYWGLEPPLAVTAWYAVDDSDVENGCMRVIPGTHRRLREHWEALTAGNLLSINQEVVVTPAEEARAVDLCLRAGEFSVHHGVLIHGSNPNRSRRRRCGLTMRYIPTHVRGAGENSQKRPWRPILVRGRDRYGHFEPIPPPFPAA